MPTTMSTFSEASLRASCLHRLTDPARFWWCTGIEDTFITAPWPKTGRTLDEYELTGHYERWFEDIGLMGELGVQAARYGIPWHRLNPRPGVWDWEFADRAFDRLLERGIEPIVDLVHYGLPSWIEGAYLHPDFPELMADYARRVGERYKGRIFAYTPLNEPRITAWYCGRIGWWPPFQRGWRGFIRVMIGVAKGIVRTVQTLKAVDPEILMVHVDATDVYEADDPSLETEAAHRQNIVFLALDLVSGRVREGHPLLSWLYQYGANPADLAWFEANAVELPVIGLNLYPMFTKKVLSRGSAGSGSLRSKMPYASGEIVSQLSRLYYQRYEAPLMIAETASVGTVRRRLAWLRDSVAAVHHVRSEGVPVVGYTWWPLFALVTWAYRQGSQSASHYLRQMGLWDLDDELRRLPTPLVEAYRQLAAGGVSAVGELAPHRRVNTSSSERRSYVS